ncbi:MAG: hypothetical protein NZ742_00415 [Acidobacteria bacterium]|nr:hypothetical protein [Acidobacteriota bacterium]MDW7983248.1 hypothetical protein [Acidobacteriota bacterium]
MFRWGTLLCSLGLMGMGLWVVQAQVKVKGVLVVATPTSPYQEVAEGFRRLMEKTPGTEFRMAYLQGAPDEFRRNYESTLRSPAYTVVAVGVDAYRAIRDQVEPSRTVTALMAVPPGGPRHTVSAVADPVQVLRLLEEMWGKNIRVGLLLGGSARSEETVFQSAAQAHGMNLRTAIVAEAAQAVDVLKALVDESDVFLLYPDPEVLAALSPELMIRYCHERRVAIAALFEGALRMGATLAFVPRYGEIPDILRQVLKYPEQFAPVSYPGVERVVVNRAALAMVRLNPPPSKLKGASIVFQ